MKHLSIKQSFALPAGELAERIGDLRYDDMAFLFAELSEKIRKDSGADLARNRPQLASQLAKLSSELHGASHTMRKIWTICAPYMEPHPETP